MQSAGPALESGAKTGPRAHVALGLLFVIGLVNYIDRVAMSVLQVPVKADLQLTDEQIGLLMGFAFSVPYTLMSIPMARVADRSNRKLILILALIVWSGMTFAVGLAGSFLVLLFLRVGVALGEACCLPTSYSLIADNYPKEMHGRAIAILGSSFPLGSMIGIVLSGYLGAELGWRGAFFAIGAIGICLVPVLVFGLKEPARVKVGAMQAAAPELGMALRDMWRRKAFRYCILGLGLQSVVSIALLTWAAPFYTRSFGLNLGQAAMLVGFVMAGASALGTLGGGLLGDRLASRKASNLMRLPAVTTIICIPIAMFQMLTGSLAISIGAALVSSVLVNVYLAPCNALIQRLALPGTRALAASVGVTSAAVFGGGLGPWFTGRVSDHMAGITASPADGLRYAIVITLLAGVGSALFFWLSARQLDRDDAASVDEGR